MGRLRSLALASFFVLLPGTAKAFPVFKEPSHCLALAMYWEAKGEGDEGMLAVASVVLNRVRHPDFPDSVCAVVTQGGETPPCQFSWWCDGRSDQPVEARAWRRAQKLAREALAEAPADRTGGALFYHASYLRTPWKMKRRPTVQIGRHVFYR